MSISPGSFPQVEDDTGYFDMSTMTSNSIPHSLQPSPSSGENKRQSLNLTTLSNSSNSTTVPAPAPSNFIPDSGWSSHSHSHSHSHSQSQTFSPDPTWSFDFSQTTPLFSPQAPPFTPDTGSIYTSAPNSSWCNTFSPPLSMSDSTFTSLNQGTNTTLTPLFSDFMPQVQTPIELQQDSSQQHYFSRPGLNRHFSASLPTRQRSSTIMSVSSLTPETPKTAHMPLSSYPYPSPRNSTSSTSSGLFRRQSMGNPQTPNSMGMGMGMGMGMSMGGKRVFHPSPAMSPMMGGDMLDLPMEGETAQEKKPPRFKPTKEQLDILIGAYEQNKNPDAATREALAKQLGSDVKPKTLQIWFQNRRSKSRAKERDALVPKISLKGRLSPISARLGPGADPEALKQLTHDDDANLILLPLRVLSVASWIRFLNPGPSHSPDLGGSIRLTPSPTLFLYVVHKSDTYRVTIPISPGTISSLSVATNLSASQDTVAVRFQLSEGCTTFHHWRIGPSTPNQDFLNNPEFSINPTFSTNSNVNTGLNGTTSNVSETMGMNEHTMSMSNISTGMGETNIVGLGQTINKENQNQNQNQNQEIVGIWEPVLDFTDGEATRGGLCELTGPKFDILPPFTEINNILRNYTINENFKNTNLSFINPNQQISPSEWSTSTPPPPPSSWRLSNQSLNSFQLNGNYPSQQGTTGLTFQQIGNNMNNDLNVNQGLNLNNGNNDNGFKYGNLNLNSKNITPIQSQPQSNRSSIDFTTLSIDPMNQRGRSMSAPIVPNTSYGIPYSNSNSHSQSNHNMGFTGGSGFGMNGNFGNGNGNGHYGLFARGSLPLIESSPIGLEFPIDSIPQPNDLNRHNNQLNDLVRNEEMDQDLHLTIQSSQPSSTQVDLSDQSNGDHGIGIVTKGSGEEIGNWSLPFTSSIQQFTSSSSSSSTLFQPSLPNLTSSSTLQSIGLKTQSNDTGSHMPFEVEERKETNEWKENTESPSFDLDDYTHSSPEMG
ncbi:hypothetical protein M231_05404 [Tremella mesenterica]|uniref:Homeobox domain-containing protein n=1 Tax=Tremella mesenterica TaxID=5217 RepID=A0A4Q1BI68_TREME|nr:hypothetical protein M231_05404 [Tremella mesenterica]